jgi:sugar phosphate isomerase/epimerase
MTCQSGNQERLMRLGYNTNGFPFHRLEDALVILADLGYESVAITLDYQALDPYAPDLARNLARVRALLERLNLHNVIETGARFLLDPRRKHQPTLLSPNAEERNRRLDFLQRAIDIAQQLGSKAVSFWSGTPVGNGPDELLWSHLTAGCQALAEFAAERGVRLAFEPEPGMFIDTLPKFQKLQRAVNHLGFGLTIDIGHLHCMGEVPIADRLREWRDWLWNVHIEDMRRGVHDHLMFGEGEIVFVAIMRALGEINYSGGVHVELSRHGHDAVEVARRSRDFLRAIWPTTSG